MPEIPIHPQLATLDREWEEERQQYLISGRFGRNVPRRSSGCALMLGTPFFLAIVALFLFVPGEMSDLQRGLCILIASVAAIAFAGFSRLEFSKYQEMKQAEAAYLQRRELLENQLRTGQIR